MPAVSGACADVDTHIVRHLHVSCTKPTRHPRTLTLSYEPSFFAGVPYTWLVAVSLAASRSRSRTGTWTSAQTDRSSSSSAAPRSSAARPLTRVIPRSAHNHTSQAALRHRRILVCVAKLQDLATHGERSGVMSVDAR